MCGNDLRCLCGNGREGGGGGGSGQAGNLGGGARGDMLVVAV